MSNRFRSGRTLSISLVFIIILAAMMWAAISISKSREAAELANADRSAMPAPTPTRLSAITPTQESSWLILPTLSPSATQADVGAEIYRLVCRDCHGDVGQGLTDEWRATWAPQDQNCWQSKCHAPVLQPEGFILPRTIPAIIGPNTLARFETSLDLYEFSRTYMPWHNPGSLTEEEYWQLTAFLVRENGVDPINVPLDQARAASLNLHSNR